MCIYLLSIIEKENVIIMSFPRVHSLTLLCFSSLQASEKFKNNVINGLDNNIMHDHYDKVNLAALEAFHRLGRARLDNQ